MSDIVNQLNKDDYYFIKIHGYPGEEIIILEEEAERIAAKPNKSNTDKVAIEYKRQLDNIFKHLDHRIAEVELWDTLNPSKKAIVLKELKRLKNRFNQ